MSALPGLEDRVLLKDTVLLQPLLCSLSWEQAWELPWVKPGQQE